MSYGTRLRRARDPRKRARRGAAARQRPDGLTGREVEVIRLVARGMTHFDLGAGEARYKSSVCNETIELYDAILPVTARGFLAAPMLTAYLRLKRRVKQTPSLINAYQRVRSALSA